MASAALRAARQVVHPVTGIEIGTRYLCNRTLADLFRSTSCPVVVPSGSRTFLGDAIVRFGGTQDQAFMNLYQGKTGIVAVLLAVVTPPTTAPTS